MSSHNKKTLVTEWLALFLCSRNNGGQPCLQPCHLADASMDCQGPSEAAVDMLLPAVVCQRPADTVLGGSACKRSVGHRSVGHRRVEHRRVEHRR
eukprot:192308-Hanusia_phi.AAC.5